MQHSQKSSLDRWIDNPSPAGDEYWRHVRFIAAKMGSDGCTCVTETFVEACYEHDIHWRTGRTINGDTITTAQANRRFKRVMQSRSRFGRFSPMAHWRYLGVTIGQHFIDHKSI
jgi:hypothetical protein